MIRNLLSIIIIVFITGCTNNEAVDVTIEDIDKALAVHQDIIILEEKDLKLTETNDFPLFSDCLLELISPTNNAYFGPNKFELKLEQFTPRGSTVDEKKKGVRLNNNGQFIYVIKNHTQVSKLNDLIIDFELGYGKTNYFLVPSRSYEMSIKNPTSALFFEYVIQEDSSIYKNIEEPAIFLCSPNGMYSESYSDKILIDFYLLNTDLQSSGNKVKIVIDDKTIFTVDKWCPYYLEGLKKGTHKISIEIVDKDGKRIDGDFTSVMSQKFTLHEIDILN